eukprot:CAMPEP_0115889772 /NCGR_PEP_ID=MMETSP0287-20121206/33004_1 /TAXON_ID=412157 /ORGANISM="Chrysochromulina rotalis, Strain UIO044" /LENGTH=36 /DNA_ID= /DNA_START= /DNA_END= /DNA_ORIENTATION=
MTARKRCHTAQTTVWIAVRHECCKATPRSHTSKVKS